MLFSYLIEALSYLINLISILIVVRALFSWLPMRSDNVINRFLITMTEPVIAPIRKLIFHFSFARELPVDFSPLLAILVLYVINFILGFL